MREQKKYHLLNDDNEKIIGREKLIEALQLLKIDEKKDGTEIRRKMDDNSIMKIIKDLDDKSPNTPITAMEHFQKELSKDNFINLLRDNRIEDKEINLCLKK